ncbi:hypothetical protein [Maribellus sediminis]|uniref:hypothetical protein n=1 Tax=Maribellus sediminis TaxID=2696285 RepID=UPI00143096C2|nr:hypothetical protein [Maribellus sediminis]
MKTKKNNATKTVLIISIGFAIIFLVTNSKWLLIVSVTVGLLGAISDKISGLIHFLWMKLAKILSYIIPNILLSLIFYLFLFPLSVLSKVFGNKDGLNLNNRNNSLWKTHDKTINKEYFEKTW